MEVASAGDGNSWVRCAQGHRHWGRFGACGLLLTDASARRVVLQHRAAGTHEGGTWGVPGGARDSHEDVVTAALRETAEEAGIAPTGVAPVGWRRDDHGGWSYTTVLGRAVGAVNPRAVNWESAQVRWCAVEQVSSLPLHPGFAVAWPAFDVGLEPVTLVLDAANVVGSRPNGWWRDRLGAATQLAERCVELARVGIAVDDLFGVLDPPSVDRMLPRIVVVVEGSAAGLAGPAGQRDDSTEDPSRWPGRQVSIVAASGDGDREVIAQAATARGTVIVVTADAQLRRLLPERVVARGPQWLWALLDA